MTFCACLSPPDLDVGPNSAAPVSPTCGGCHRVYWKQLTGAWSGLGVRGQTNLYLYLVRL